MNEDNINPEQGLDKDIEKNEKKLNEQYQEQTKGNEMLRKRQEEARAKKKQRINRRKQIEASQKQAEELRKRNREEAIQDARAKMGNKAPKVYNREGQEVLDDGTTVVTDEDMRTEGPIADVEDEGFLQSAMKTAGKVLTVYGQAMDKVDKEVLGRVGFGDKNLYTARRGIIDGLSQRHVALALLGEFLLPDTVDLATLGLSYIPKRFLKTPKLLKMWAKSTKAATKSEAAGDFAGAAILGGRPRLARRTEFNELGDIDELDQISKYYPQMQKASADVSKGTETFKKPLTTPERTKQKILEGKKSDVLDLEAATQGPGIEGKPGSPKYSKAVRAGVTKIDKKLVSSLQKKYGGTDEQAKQFLQIQKDTKRQIEEARVALNKEFKLRQFGFAYEDMMDALEGFDDLLRGLGPDKAMQAMKKVKPDITQNELMNFADALRVDAGSYDIGHIVAAKNQFRKGQKGADFASNLELEPARNLVEISLDRRRNEVVKLVEKGNRGRGSRADLPLLINRIRGVSNNIDEEYVKFLHPDLTDVLENLLPTHLHDDFIKSTMEALEAKRRIGYHNFNAFLNEVLDLNPQRYQKLDKKTKKVIRDAYKNQLDFVNPQQQLDMFNKGYGNFQKNPNGYKESWVEEAINNYLEDSLEARELGLLDRYLKDRTLRGFDAPEKYKTIRKIGEKPASDGSLDRINRDIYEENPLIKPKRGRPKKKKP